MFLAAVYLLWGCAHAAGETPAREAESVPATGIGNGSLVSGAVPEAATSDARPTSLLRADLWPDYENVRKAYDAVRGESVGSWLAWQVSLRKAEALYNSGQAADAWAAFSALEQEPTDITRKAVAIYGQAASLAALGRWHEAATTMDTLHRLYYVLVVKSVPADLEIAFRQGYAPVLLRPEVRYLDGVCSLHEGKLDRAVADFGYYAMASGAPLQEYARDVVDRFRTSAASAEVLPSWHPPAANDPGAFAEMVRAVTGENAPARGAAAPAVDGRALRAVFYMAKGTELAAVEDADRAEAREEGSEPPRDDRWISAARLYRAYLALGGEARDDFAFEARVSRGRCLARAGEYPAAIAWLRGLADSSGLGRLQRGRVRYALGQALLQGQGVALAAWPEPAPKERVGDVSRVFELARDQFRETNELAKNRDLERWGTFMLAEASYSETAWIRRNLEFLRVRVDGPGDVSETAKMADRERIQELHEREAALEGAAQYQAFLRMAPRGAVSVAARSRATWCYLAGGDFRDASQLWPEVSQIRSPGEESLLQKLIHFLGLSPRQPPATSEDAASLLVAVVSELLSGSNEEAGRDLEILYQRDDERLRAAHPMLLAFLMQSDLASSQVARVTTRWRREAEAAKAYDDPLWGSLLHFYTGEGFVRSETWDQAEVEFRRAAEAARQRPKGLRALYHASILGQASALAHVSDPTGKSLRASQQLLDGLIETESEASGAARLAAAGELFELSLRAADPSLQTAFADDAVQQYLSLDSDGQFRSRGVAATGLRRAGSLQKDRLREGEAIQIWRRLAADYKDAPEARGIALGIGDAFRLRESDTATSQEHEDAVRQALEEAKTLSPEEERKAGLELASLLHRRGNEIVGSNPASGAAKLREALSLFDKYLSDQPRPERVEANSGGASDPWFEYDQAIVDYVHTLPVEGQVVEADKYPVIRRIYPQGPARARIRTERAEALVREIVGTAKATPDVLAKDQAEAEALLTDLTRDFPATPWAGSAYALLGLWVYPETEKPKAEAALITFLSGGYPDLDYGDTFLVSYPSTRLEVGTQLYALIDRHDPPGKDDRALKEKAAAYTIRTAVACYQKAEQDSDAAKYLPALTEGCRHWLEVAIQGPPDPEVEAGLNQIDALLAAPPAGTRALPAAVLAEIRKTRNAYFLQTGNTAAAEQQMTAEREALKVETNGAGRQARLQALVESEWTELAAKSKNGEDAELDGLVRQALSDLREIAPEQRADAWKPFRTLLQNGAQAGVTDRVVRWVDLALAEPTWTATEQAPLYEMKGKALLHGDHEKAADALREAVRSIGSRWDEDVTARFVEYAKALAEGGQVETEAASFVEQLLPHLSAGTSGESQPLITVGAALAGNDQFDAEQARQSAADAAKSGRTEAKDRAAALLARVADAMPPDLYRLLAVYNSVAIRKGLVDATEGAAKRALTDELCTELSDLSRRQTKNKLVNKATLKDPNAKPILDWLKSVRKDTCR